MQIKEMETDIKMRVAESANKCKLTSKVIDGFAAPAWKMKQFQNVGSKVADLLGDNSHIETRLEPNRGKRLIKMTGSNPQLKPIENPYEAQIN